MTTTEEKRARDRGAGEQRRDVEVEQEVDLGRFWRAVLSRWWLPVAGLVAGAIIGLLVSIGGGKEYKASAEVYLGQPLAPGGSTQVSSISTLLALASNYATSEAAIRNAAARAGYDSPGQLRGHVSTKPLLGITGSKLGTAAPIVQVTVTGSSRPRVARASNTIAQSIVRKLAVYSTEKLATLEAQAARDEQQLEQVQQRIDAAIGGQQRLLGSGDVTSTDKLVALANYNLVISSATSQQTALQNDQSAVKQQIAAIQNIEAPRVFAPGAATSTGGPSRRSGVVIGAIIGFILGLIAALVWQPVTTYLRSHPE